MVSGPSSKWGIATLFGVGGHGNADVLIQDGGTVTVGGTSTLAPQKTSTGIVTVTGSGSSLLASSRADRKFNIGSFGYGQLSVLDGGLMTASSIVMAVNTGSTGLLSLAGDASARGIVSTSGITGGNGTASIVFDGGILKASLDNADFLSGFASGDVQFLSRGAFIDTDGHDIGISAAIVGVGDLTKFGAGSLTLSGTNAYRNTRVDEGSVFGDVGSISGNIHLNGAATVLTFTDTGGAFYDREISGDGTVSSTGPAITIADGGSIAPGNSGIGTLTVAGTWCSRPVRS